VVRLLREFEQLRESVQFADLSQPDTFLPRAHREPGGRTREGVAGPVRGLIPQGAESESRYTRVGPGSVSVTMPCLCIRV